MLQRIQSIFLLLAGVCAILPYSLPVATTETNSAESYLFADGSFTSGDDTLLLVCFGLAALLWLADIFLYQNRILQIRLSTLALLLVVIGGGYGGFLLGQDSAEAQSTLSAGIALPIAAMAFGLLAIRYIRADENLVRSSDRLR